MDNITSKETEHGDYDYEYDNLYRLTTADNPIQDDEAFTYDTVGNRLTAADTTGNWAYNQNNELGGYDTISFEYDANGNMVKKTVGTVVTSYVYNTEDRLTQVWSGEAGTGSLIAEYYYDPFGRRLWKEVSGVRTYSHYADEGLIGEYDSTGTEIKTYGYKPGSTWTTDPLFLKEDGQYYFYQNDHLGTPQKLTAVNGAVVWSAKYTSFLKADIDPTSTIENNLRAAGQYEDQETGLFYNYHRFYNPTLGRYLRTDPIGFKGGDTNVYSYTSNNPLSFVDPYGKCKWTGVFTILGGSAAGGGGATGQLLIKSECCNGKEAGGEYVWTAVGAMPGPAVITASWSEVEFTGPGTPSKNDPVGLFHYIGGSAALIAGPGYSHIYSGAMEGKGWSWVFGFDVGFDSIVGKTWNDGGAYEKECCDE